MALLADIPVELMALVGTTRLPLGELAKLGRGAIIALGVSPDAQVTLHAGGRAVAAGDLVVTGDIVTVTVTALVQEQG